MIRKPFDSSSWLLSLVSLRSTFPLRVVSMGRVASVSAEELGRMAPLNRAGEEEFFQDESWKFRRKAENFTV